MSKKLHFCDESLLSTPNPISSSSMSSKRQKMRISTLSEIDDIPQRLSDLDDSLGLLSIKSSEVEFAQIRTSDAALKRIEERAKAAQSLKEYSRNIPSKFLRPSDLSDSSEVLMQSESTISDSDLLGNCSTPRNSLLNQEIVMKDRESVSKNISVYANCMRDTSCDMGAVISKLEKMMTDSDFKSGESALAQLQADEMSWKRQKDLPVERKDFSEADVSVDSVGSFFQKRSEGLSILGPSPSKPSKPMPLIEPSQIKEKEQEKESLGVSYIQKILASEGSITKAIDDLLVKPPKREEKENVPEPQIKSILSSKSSSSFENVPEPQIKSILSSRSSSSLSSLPNGKLPIATTKTEIIWGCIRPGKSSSQDFILRNKSASRIAIHAGVSNPSFRINKDGTESVFTSAMKIILHPYESRLLNVTFAPTNIGGAVDVLNFTSMDPSHKQTNKQFIKLFGYGGYGNMCIQDIIKDTTGKFLLSLGNVDENQKMKKTFRIKNNGTLASFAYFDFFQNCSHSFTNVEVEPPVAVLLPGEDREIEVSYTLEKSDFTYIKTKINNCVIDIGKLQVSHGTEVDRARLRRVSQKAKEKNHLVNSFITNIVKKFPGEIIYSDVKQFKESLGSIDELVRLLNQEEIVVTLEQDVDQTLTGDIQNETAMFHSLCENSAMLDTTVKEGCSVEPTKIVLTPPAKVKDMILLSNHHKRSIYFEVASSPEGLKLNPVNGKVAEGQTVIIELLYNQKKHRDDTFKVKILVDNDSFEVVVKVICISG